MSLVGPRPERPSSSPSSPRPARVTRPGTGCRSASPGLAQVHGLRGDTSIEDRARFDNPYIDNWSLWQDIRILLRTVARLVRPEGR